MSDNGYSKIIFKEIRNRISQNHPKSKQKNKHIQKLICPVCEKEEAWAYYEKPLAIICPRANHCGAITPIKELYPDCFQNFSKRFPSSEKDPNATARAYLISRGLDPSKFEFKQWKIIDEDDKKEYATVQFQVNSKITFHRLIDYSGKKKTFIFGKYKGKVWIPKNFDPSKETWIVESIINALTLIQSGFQAIAILSAAHFPEEFYQKKSFLKIPIVLAFDGDRAGKEAVDKHIKFFKEIKKENYEVALPPDEKDWNDLLLFGSFSEECLEKTLSDSFWRGLLHTAKDIRQYHSIYSKRYSSEKIGFYTGLLEYNNEYHYVSSTIENTDKAKSEIPKFTKLSRFTMKLLFSIEDDSIEYESDIVNIVEIKTKRKTSLVKFTANEFTQNSEFKKKLMRAARVLWLGTTPKHINLISNHLLNTPSPVIRKINFLGYDKKSNAHVISNFLYNKDGERETVNQFGFFQKQKIKGMLDETVIQSFKQTSITKFLSVIQNVYGYKGLLVFGYYAATFFNFTIVKVFRAFSFFSLYGKPDTGKTTLIDALNMMCFLDWPGIVASELSTKKSVARQLSSKVALPVPFLESNHKLIGINEGSLLNAYHQGSLQDRAAYTNDNQTNSLPFKGGLIFVQNDEPFTRKAVKQRVVSVEFLSEDCTEYTKKWMVELKRYSPQQLASIGHQILAKRKEIEPLLIENIKKTIIELEKSGIETNRIQFTHAVVFSAFSTIAKIFGFEFDQKLFFEELVSIAKEKEESASNESVVGQDFLDAFETLKNNQLQKGIHYLEDKSSYYIRLAETLKVMKQQDYTFVQNPFIHDALKKHEQCKRSNFQKNSSKWNLKNRKQKAWEFSK